MATIPVGQPRIDFSRFDKTGREPRGIQKQFLDWLSEGWYDVGVHAGQIPVGGGKSLVAETIKLATKGHGITPSNVLIDQYTDTYPKANFLKGKARYTCKSGLACSDWTDVMRQPACSNCPYEDARMRAIKGESTYFNPMSLFYFNLRRDDFKPYSCLVVDEAHQIPSMVELLTSKRIRKSLYKWDERCSVEIYLVQWLKGIIRKLDKLANTYSKVGNYEKLKHIVEEISSLGMVLEGFEYDPQNYAIYTEKSTYRGRPEWYLNIRPIRPPQNIVRKLLACDKLVLLSGTLLPTDIDDMAAGRPYRLIDLPSPIPPSQRPILYRPMPFPVNVDTNPADIAQCLERVLDEFPGNAIVHVTYSLSKKLVPHIKRPILHNTSENKQDMLAKFKKEGGVFVASGCAEGLDLKDDLCRVNIIPRLSYPDMSDPVVMKRRALPNGHEWYDLQTLKIAIQQAGRSTRHETDFSTTIIMDPRFSTLVQRYHKKLPRSFTEAVQWRVTRS